MSITDYVIDRVKLNPEHESPLMFGGNRWNFLPDLFNWAGFTVGAEIGVGSGRFSRRLCETVAGLKLYAVDPWEYYDYYEGRVTQAAMDRSYRKAVEALDPFNCEIIRAYSQDAVKRFENDSLDFIYLDANRNFYNVTEDLAQWSHKVRPGGVISGCCYYNERDHAIGQVKNVVDYWTRANKIEPWFIIVHYRYPVYFWAKK